MGVFVCVCVFVYLSLSVCVYLCVCICVYLFICLSLCVSVCVCVVAGKNIDINAAKNIELQANDVQAGNSIYVGNTLMQRQADGTLKAADGSVMPENVKLSTLETHDQQWDEQQKGYRGVVKELMKVTEVGLAGVQSLFPGVKVGVS